MGGVGRGELRVGALAEGAGCSLVGEETVWGRGEGAREGVLMGEGAKEEGRKVGAIGEVVMGEGAIVEGRKAGGEGVSNCVVSVIFWGLGVCRMFSWGVPARVGSWSLGREVGGGSYCHW